MFGGTSDVQLCGDNLKIYCVHVTVVNVFKRNVSLFFFHLYIIPIVTQMNKSH